MKSGTGFTKKKQIADAIADIDAEYPKPSARNLALRSFCRAYPFSKGRYRLMTLCEALLDRKKVSVGGLHRMYRFSLDLAQNGLQSSFYYFFPECYEPETQRYISETATPGMCVMDIGAHMGLLTLLMAKCVGASGRVYGFEPEEGNFKRLNDNLLLNQISNVRTFKMALSDRGGEMNLFLCAQDTGHSLIRGEDGFTVSEGAVQRVQTIALDDFLRQEGVPRVDIIKIDAEGGERLILEGAKRVLSDGMISRWICEIHSAPKIRDSGSEEVRKIFYSHGYKSYTLNERLSGKKYLSEFFPEEPVRGLQNFLFLKP